MIGLYYTSMKLTNMNYKELFFELVVSPCIVWPIWKSPQPQKNTKFLY
jgi:hypothetical protein